MTSLFATRLKNRRKEFGWSQKELAEGVCEQGQISRMEKGTYSPGSELLYALSKKLGVSMNYFFDTDVPTEESTLTHFRKIAQQFIVNRDYESLRYVYQLEQEKEANRTFADKIYLIRIEAIIEFRCNQNPERAIELLEEAIEAYGLEDTQYLYLFNTLFVFYLDSKENAKLEKLYRKLSYWAEKVNFDSIEELTSLIGVRYNYSRYLWKNEKSDIARDEILDTIELCQTYHINYLLADLYCLLGNVSEDLSDKEISRSYFQNALLLYKLFHNEKLAQQILHYLEEGTDEAEESN